jgi:transcriptional regulator with XRE-family HTH domain
MNTTTYVPFSTVLAESLKDPAVRAEWERTAVVRALSAWLVRYRQEHSMTQADLADMLGMKQPAVARLEAAEHEPSIPTLRKLAKHIGVKIALTIEPECIAVDMAIWPPPKPVTLYQQPGGRLRRRGSQMGTPETLAAMTVEPSVLRRQAKGRPGRGINPKTGAPDTSSKPQRTKRPAG